MNTKRLKKIILWIFVVCICILLGLIMLRQVNKALKPEDQYAELREFMINDNWNVYYNGKGVDVENFDFDKEYSGIMINNELKKMELKQTYKPGDMLYVGIKLDVTIVEELKENE